MRQYSRWLVITLWGKLELNKFEEIGIQKVFMSWTDRRIDINALSVKWTWCKFIFDLRWFSGLTMCLGVVHVVKWRWLYTDSSWKPVIYLSKNYYQFDISPRTIINLTNPVEWKIFDQIHILFNNITENIISHMWVSTTYKLKYKS